jgi:catechol 2,3-dioxygenase
MAQEGPAANRSAGAASTAASIHPRTALGAIRLRVADLDRAQGFYEEAIGLRTLERDPDAARLGAGDATPVVELEASPGAPPRAPGTTGLFHLAVLLPSRLELARAVRRVADAGWRLSGASDHLVSEALYLRDPDGNGIELYRDRPREEWRYADGTLQMDTLPLDLESVLAELDETGEGRNEVAPETRLGHVHLQVSDLADAESFYHGVLGFDVTVRTYPGALFVSADDYHHHIGLNVWTSEGAPPPAPGSLGLAWFEIVLPGGDEVERVARRVEAAGIDARREHGALRLADPSGNGVLLRASPGP